MDDLEEAPPRPPSLTPRRASAGVVKRATSLSPESMVLAGVQAPGAGAGAGGGTSRSEDEGRGSFSGRRRALPPPPFAPRASLGLDKLAAAFDSVGASIGSLASSLGGPPPLSALGFGEGAAAAFPDTDRHGDDNVGGADAFESRRSAGVSPSRGSSASHGLSPLHSPRSSSVAATAQKYGRGTPATAGSPSASASLLQSFNAPRGMRGIDALSAQLRQHGSLQRPNSARGKVPPIRHHLNPDHKATMAAIKKALNGREGHVDKLAQLAADGQHNSAASPLSPPSRLCRWSHSLPLARAPSPVLSLLSPSPSPSLCAAVSRMRP